MMQAMLQIVCKVVTNFSVGNMKIRHWHSGQGPSIVNEETTKFVVEVRAYTLIYTSSSKSMSTPYDSNQHRSSSICEA